jgi:hypothetical protein
MPRTLMRRTIRRWRKQLENLGLQMPPKDKLAPGAPGAWQKAEIAKMVADDQGRQGGLAADQP